MNDENNEELEAFTKEELWELRATLEFSYEFAEYIKQVDKTLFERAKDYALGKKYENVTFYKAT